MGHDEHGQPRRSRGSISAPKRDGPVVGTTTGDDGTYTLAALGQNTAVALILAERPLVEPLAPDTQRLIRGGVGGFDEASTYLKVRYLPKR
jgi:hypothetical protein